MSEEQIFRAVVLVSLLGVLPIGSYYRVKSQATRERLDRRQEGMFILTTLRPVAAACWVGMIAWLIDPRSMAWSAVSVPVAFRWAGVAVLFSGAALLIWTVRSLGPNLTDTVVTRQKHTLVMRGPYRWIRHPLYLSTALLVVAMSLVAANWFLAATGAMVCGLLVIRTRTEEGNLIVRFGDDYRQYMQRTGGFLPRVRANRHDA